MWELLGVNNDFKRKFISFARTLTSESIKDYYNYEISNLTKYNDILTVSNTKHTYIINNYLHY